MKIISILIPIVLFANTSKSQQLTKDEIIQVNLSANSFLSMLAEFSNCKGGADEGKFFGEILSAKDGTDATDFICNDLFPEITGDFEDNLNWLQYLRYIEDYFNFNIDVNNDNEKILDCRISSNGNYYALYEVDKLLTYQDKKLNQKIILVINLQTYKIKEIVSPLFFSKNNSSCESINQGNDEQMKNLRQEADLLYSNKDYKNALNIYTKIIENDASDLLAKTKYEDCKNKVSYIDLLSKADNDFENKKFELAKNEYANILKSYNVSDKEKIKNRIKQCQELIIDLDFQKEIQLGDYYFNIANFEQARKYYSNALTIKPNDRRALSKLEKSKHGDQNYVLEQIRKAEKLAESSRKNFGEAFEILSEYEPSGLLGVKNYIFLTEMMDQKNGDVKRQMHYNYRNCQNYLRIYAKKLYDAVQKETDPELRNRGAIILDRVINSRYQN